jgi:lipopolysaccharide transport system ATP-binding protein
MAAESIIVIEKLGKKYSLRHQVGESYVAFRDVIADRVKALFRRGSKDARRATSYEEFWALKDISFEVKPGEVVGIIGRNGAGKSTLLKILSRITEPTEGRARVRGRVGSLLEVGTGFHPELTGRENIFLNGAILGMTKAEIRRKFDEIVDFAEIEKFLDTPIKRYSSGMYVRLAFAVAAHLEPEILIVDEVLAVGDAGFQKKCLGKMQQVSDVQGRTVLFVSHNLGTVKALCKTGILLKEGRLDYLGNVSEAVERYLGACDSQSSKGSLEHLPRPYFTGEARLQYVSISGENGEPAYSATIGEPINIRVQWEVIKPIPNAMIEIGLLDQDGRQITQSFSSDNGRSFLNLNPGVQEIRLRIDDLIFPGRYSILVGIHKENGETVDFVERALDFEVLNTGRGEPNHYPFPVRGYLRPAQTWLGPHKVKSSYNGNVGND